MSQPSHAIERHVASFARAVAGPEAPAVHGPGTAAEAAALKADLLQVTALYEESLCVWEHEMGLLQARLARAGEMDGEVARLRAVSDEALRNARQKEEEITRLFARIAELQRENQQLGREARLLSGQLRAAWRARPVRSGRGLLSRAAQHIRCWTKAFRHFPER